jgi:hypothetical protein
MPEFQKPRLGRKDRAQGILIKRRQRVIAEKAVSISAKRPIMRGVRKQSLIAQFGPSEQWLQLPKSNDVRQSARRERVRLPRWRR